MGSVGEYPAENAYVPGLAPSDACVPAASFTIAFTIGASSN
jgi:hypothetical protein